MGGTYKMRKEAWTSEPLALGFGCRSRTLPGEGEGKRNKKIHENTRKYKRYKISGGPETKHLAPQKKSNDIKTSAHLPIRCR